jgi:hypothetical protein
MAKDKEKEDKTKKSEEFVAKLKDPDKPIDIPADKAKEEPTDKLEGLKKELEETGIETEKDLPVKLDKGKRKEPVEAKEVVDKKSAEKVGESGNGSNAMAEFDDESFEELFNLDTMTLVENVSGLALSTIVENIGIELKSLKKKERREVRLYLRHLPRNWELKIFGLQKIFQDFLIKGPLS